jgi:hypothetical protein
MVLFSREDVRRLRPIANIRIHVPARRLKLAYARRNRWRRSSPMGMSMRPSSCYPTVIESVVRGARLPIFEATALERKMSLSHARARMHHGAQVRRNL